jgi:hypothetical protein
LESGVGTSFDGQFNPTAWEILAPFVFDLRSWAVFVINLDFRGRDVMTSAQIPSAVAFGG